MGMRPKIREMPDRFCFERELYDAGVRLIAGVDEVGRGPLAGPVVASSVILPKKFNLVGVKDSKQLTPKQRDFFCDEIKNISVAYAFGFVSSSEIDSINIHQATLRAMKAAVVSLSVKPDYILIDGQFGIKVNIPQKPIIKGDDLSFSIAAASIIAKVSRDQMMCEYEQKYPMFQFSVHKGYGTKKHLEELKRYGPTPIHRMTFRGVKS